MKEILEIPEGVKLSYENGTFSVAGKLGEVKKILKHPLIEVTLKGSTITLFSINESRNAKRLMKTFVSHIKSLFKGVQKGFVYKLKIVFTHFPTTVKIKDDKILIENFIGERSPRVAKKFPGVEVKINKQDVTVSGIDLYAVSRTAANIERTAKIVGKDRRIFQDGIYIIEKGK
jgi:large subunit ribosomal protein L6